MSPGSASARASLPLLALLAAALLPPPALSQTPPALVPAGHLRVGITASSFHWDERFGVREEDGVLVEATEPLGFDLTRERASDLFPGVAALEEDLRALLDDPAYRATLGSSRARVSHSVSRIPLRADLGLFDWLTIGVAVPFVRTRTEATLTLRVEAVANLGLNPAVSSPSALAAFLDDLAAAAAAAAGRAGALCSAGAAGCADAEELAAEAAAFEARLRSAYGAAPLFPGAWSPAGRGLRGRLASLNERLSASGVEAVGAALPLAESPLNAEGFERLFSDARAGIQAPAPGKIVGLWEMGDVELTAAARLLDGEVRDSAGAPARARWLLGVRALVRLGTGTPEDPDVFLDLGSGDAQTDVEVGAFANARWGAFGLRLDARYGRQAAVQVVRRVAPPEVVLAPVSTRFPVRWTPGAYALVEASPRWHLNGELSLAGTWRLFTKASDAFEYASSPPLPLGVALPDPSFLSRETGMTLHELGAALVYSTLDAWRQGRTGLPFEATFGVRVGVAGSGGRTPRGVRVHVGLRVHQAFWGG